MATKRKREDDITGPRKLARGQLLRKYAKRSRDIVEVLNKGSLDVGHVIGTLDAIDRVPGMDNFVSLRIIGEEDKILVCDLDAPELVRNYNGITRKIGKQIKLAISDPIRHPVENPAPNEYRYKLVFGKYQFLLDEELYEDRQMASWMEDTESEEEANPSNKNPKSMSINEATQMPRTASISSVPSTTLNPPTAALEELKWTLLRDALVKHPTGNITIAGVVTNVDKAPFQLGGDKDWAMTVHLVDASCTNAQFLELKIYAKKFGYLPPLDSNNDIGKVLLISDIRITEKKPYVFGVARSQNYRYICYPDERGGTYIRLPGGLRTSELIAPYRPNARELYEMEKLEKWYKGESMPAPLQRRTESIQQPKATARHQEEHMLIQDIKDKDFFECTVEVLNVYADNDKAAVYVTDYTSNPLLKDPGTARWSFPTGQKTLRIQLYDRPKEQADSLASGYVYRFRHVRFESNGQYSSGKCGKFKNEENEIVYVGETDSDPHYAALIKRKAAYEKEKAKQTTTKGTQKENKRPKKSNENTTQVHTFEDPPSPPKVRQPSQQQSNEPLQPISTATPQTERIVPDTVEPVSAPERKPMTAPEPPKLPKSYPPFPEYLASSELSSNIQSSHASSLQLSTIDEIHTSWAVPELFKFRGRVVDVEPKDLRDAVTRYCTACKDVCREDERGRCTGCEGRDCIEFRVRIAITFQDASGELLVNVGDDNAIKFFRLSQKSRQSRERLFATLLARFEAIMGPLSEENKYEINGASDIYEIVVKNWQIPVQQAGIASLWYKRCYAPSGCRIQDIEASS